MLKSPEGQEPNNIATGKNQPANEVVGEIVKTPELTKEAEPKQGVFIIYRDNDLYSEHIPTLAKVMQGNGRQVETQVFPKGAPEAQLAKWYEEHESELEGKMLLADTTFIRSLEPVLAPRKSEGRYKFSKQLPRRAIHNSAEIGRGYLDILFDNATAEAITGTSEKGLDNLESERGEGAAKVRNAMVNLLKRILLNPQNVPKRVEIGLEFLEHHLDEQLIANLKEIFVEGGIDAKTINIRPSLGKYAQPGIDQPGNWLVVDRHRVFDIPPQRATVLELPVGNFFQDAARAGLIKVKPEEMEGAIKKITDKDVENKFDVRADDINELYGALSEYKISPKNLTAEERQILADRLDIMKETMEDFYKKQVIEKIVRLRQFQV